MAASVLLMLSLFSTPLLAQDADSSAFRHEIAVNSRHYVLFLAGARTSPYHHLTFSFLFRHFALRLGMDYKHAGRDNPLDQYQRYSNLHLRLPHEEVYYSSSEFGRYRADYTLSSLRLRPGFEALFGGEKLSYVLGFDVLAGAVPVTANLHLTNFRLDASGNPVAYETVEVSSARERSVMRLLGVSPFTGLRYKFTENLGIAVRLGFEMYNVQGTIRYRDEKGFSYLRSINDHEVYSTGVLNDISFFFQF